MYACFFFYFFTLELEMIKTVIVKDIKIKIINSDINIQVNMYFLFYFNKIKLVMKAVFTNGSLTALSLFEEAFVW